MSHQTVATLSEVSMVSMLSRWIKNVVFILNRTMKKAKLSEVANHKKIHNYCLKKIKTLPKSTARWRQWGVGEAIVL